MAMRSSQWSLRVAAIKEMAPLFTAFDRPKYQKLIPQHIRDLFNLPKDVLANLEKGGFTVSLLGRPGHSVGVDEAHEMCVNRECKEFITHPSSDNISRTSLFLPIRSRAMNNLEEHLFPERNKESVKTITSLFATDIESKKLESNIRKQVDKLQSSNFITGTSTGLCHLFKTKQLTPQQTHDLINFRAIGESEYNNRVEYYILRNPSVRPPKHRKRLLTFTEKIARRKKGSEIERERKLQIECWKKRAAYATSTGSQMHVNYEQCLELPRAIATSDGAPMKGSKSNTTNVLQKRYEKAENAIFSTSLKPSWVPHAVVMEGMFLINITPWSAHQNMGDYANFLISQHIYSHFRNGSTEVHLLFDDPECVHLSPKYFERLHRDKTTQLPEDHHCSEFTSDMIIPPKWRSDILSCRICKRNLVCFLSTYFLTKIQHKLNPQQMFITAGGFRGDQSNKAFFVTSASKEPQCNESLYCNAEESDTHIWLHVINSTGTKKLVLSPDTDVYHIGLPIISGTELECVVRLRVLGHSNKLM